MTRVIDARLGHLFSVTAGLEDWCIAHELDCTQVIVIRGDVVVARRVPDLVRGIDWTMQIRRLVRPVPQMAGIDMSDADALRHLMDIETVMLCRP